MARALIRYRARSTTQSDHANQGWELLYQPTQAETNDPLMGWWGGGDMQSQVKLGFDSLDDALDYVRRHGIPHDVELHSEHQGPPKAYADNFRYGRSENWTH